MLLFIDINNTEVQTEEVISPLHQVTPLSKYLAGALFIILPFLGAYIGYVFAPEKVVEVKVGQDSINNTADEQNNSLVDSIELQTENEWPLKNYLSLNGYLMQIPAEAEVVENPAIHSYSANTSVSGDFGKLCVSVGYSCGGRGFEDGWVKNTKVLTSADGSELTFSVFNLEGDNRIYMSMVAINPVPKSFTDNAQILLETTEDKLEKAESILTSLNFSTLTSSGSNN